MTTSGVYSFATTRDTIIRQAMLNIGKLDPNRSPMADETTDCSTLLNMMCKQWMGKADFAPGLKVWTEKRGALLLNDAGNSMPIGPSEVGWTSSWITTTLASAAAASDASVIVTSYTGMAANDVMVIRLDDNSLFYTTVSGTPVSTTVSIGTVMSGAAAAGAMVFVYTTAAQNPRHVSAVVLRQSTDGTDTPMRMMTSQGYDSLTNKANVNNAGDPNAVYIKMELASTTVFMDVGAAIDTSKFLVLTYLEPVQDFVNPLDNPYYPQEWYLALVWGLTEQICPMFRATWTDKMENLKTTAMMIARNVTPENTELYWTNE